MRRVLVCVAFVALQAVVLAQDATFHVSLLGKKVGTNQVKTLKSGQFESLTTLSIMGNNVRSLLTVDIKDGKVGDLSADVEARAAKVKFQVKGKGLSVTVSGNTTDFDLAKIMAETDAYFDQEHPITSVSLFTEFDKDPSRKKMKVRLPATLAVLDCGVSMTERVAETSQGVINLRELKMTLQGITLHMIQDKKSGMILGYFVPSQEYQFIREGYDGIHVDPVAKYKELSQPTAKVLEEKAVKVPMRDGISLVSDVIRPQTEEKVPTILVRTPYGREVSALEAGWWAQRGYAYVVQDVRGRGASEGDWDPFMHEVADGKDTLDWITRQKWSNGKVGMIGASYLGFVQWAAAVTHHPALKCIIPQVSPPDPTRNIPHENGASMLLGNVWWARIVKSKNADLGSMSAGFANLNGFLTKPITRVDDVVLGEDVPFYNQWFKRTTIEDWPGAFQHRQISGVRIPVMHISGTWDGDGVGTMLHWEALRGKNPNQWVIFGPWTHAFNSTTEIGEVKYGPGAILELKSSYLRFFDTFLKGLDVGMQKVPKVKFFVSGANYWEHSSDFPLPTTKPVRKYLSDGRTLGHTPGKGQDKLRYDPNQVKIVESDFNMMEGKILFPASYASEARSAIFYRGDIFSQPKMITGPVKVDLYFSTTARDVTFHAFAFDQYPDGRLLLLGLPGTQRATYVNGQWTKIRPGQIRRMELRPWWFAHQFAPGHRLVLVLTNDYFPNFARNPGTGEHEATARKYIASWNTIHRSAKYPSSVSWYESD